MADSSSEDGKFSPVVREAQERFQYWQDYTSIATSRYISDTKFAEADSDNQWQWPDEYRTQREIDARPVVTVNKIKPLVRQIVNEIFEDLPNVKIKPTGNGATFEAAKAYMGMVRQIQYNSNAKEAYKAAALNMVRGGVGYVRLRTDYCEPDSFDQEILIDALVDSTRVGLDPDAVKPDKSDAKWGFVFVDLPRKLFEQRYPKFKELVGLTPIGADGWLQKDHVRIAEYYRVVEKLQWLYAVRMPDGTEEIVLEEQIPADVRKEVIADPNTRKRKTTTLKVEWYKIAGHEVVEQTEWIGSTIPIVKFVAEEITIEGQYDCKGHTRNLKDAQRMYNYWSSNAVEFGALQPKIPWIAPARAIEGFETYWNTANRVNHAVLPYNDVDDDGAQVAAPQRSQSPTAAPAYIVGMQTASDELMAASGQHAAAQGQQDNTRTGVALRARQGRSDLSNFHYRDAVASGMVYIGRMLIEVIPKLYDTRRVVQVMAQDGTTVEMQIDPSAKQAFALTQAKTLQGAQAIFNPNVGKYWVEADSGSGWLTKREQTVQALSIILTQNPQLASIVGDLLLREMDFPAADEASERLRRMVPPQALGIGPTPKEQELNSQNEQLMLALGETLNSLGEKQLQLKGKDAKRDIDAYKAETDRFSALAKAGVDANGLQMQIMQLINDTVAQMAATGTPGEVESGKQGLSGTTVEPGTEAPPIPNAKKAPDGEWYVGDEQQGFAKVMPNG